MSSNFKLFSKNASSPEKLGYLAPPIIDSKPGFLRGWMPVIVVLSFCVFAYYHRSWFNTGFLDRLWVASHLNSAGELTSVYVPDDFSPTNAFKRFGISLI